MTLDYGRRGQPPPAMFFYHTHADRHRSQSHKKCKPREQLKHHQQSKIHKQNTRRRRRNWNWKEQTRRTKAIWIVYCERHSREIFVHSNFQTYVYVVVFFAVAGDSSCCRKRVTPQQHFRIDRLLLLFNTYHYCCSVAAFHCLCVCVCGAKSAKSTKKEMWWWSKNADAYSSSTRGHVIRRHICLEIIWPLVADIFVVFDNETKKKNTRICDVRCGCTINCTWSVLHREAFIRTYERQNTTHVLVSMGNCWPLCVILSEFGHLLWFSHFALRPIKHNLCENK